MGWSLGLNFWTLGLPASLGSWPLIWATRWLTSMAASLTLTSELNWATTTPKPSLANEVTELRPGMVVSAPSMGSLICREISSGPAPP